MYKLTKGVFDTEPSGVWKASENKWIPFDPANTDYQQYLKWLEEGNVPTPAEEQQ